MESGAARDPQAAPKPKAPAKPVPTTIEPAPAAPVVVERAIRPRWYWITFFVSLVSLIIVWLYYSGRLYPWLQVIYWVTGALALGLLVWSVAGLLARYNVFGRVTASAQRFREREGAEGEQAIVYRENIVVRLFKTFWRLVTLLVLFVWNTFLRLLHEVFVLAARLIILFYDIVYYVGYAAWSLAHIALRIALRLTLWALRTAWKIVRIVTYLPILKGIWRKKMRPAILARWNARMQERREKAALRLEQKRRLVAAKGMDPDKWQADRVARRHFFLPHPHQGRRGIRAWIEERQRIDYNRRDRWAAFRKGLPMPPKYHSDRKKAKLEEKKKRKSEKRQDEGAGEIRKAKRPKGERRVAGGASEPRPVPDDK